MNMNPVESRRPRRRSARAGLITTIVLLGMSASVNAIPQLLPTATPGQPVARVVGVNLPSTDLILGLKTVDGAVIDTADGALFRYAAPPSFSLLASRANPVVVDGATVGTLHDFVYRDTADNRLVFGLRLVLAQAVNGAANTFEVNDFYRRGNAGFTATASWSRASDADLRMYAAVRSATKFGQGVELFDPDVVKFQSDVNTSEGNPRSGYFWLKSNAPTFKTVSNGLAVYQGGEEGQPQREVVMPGFVPSSQPDNDNDGYDAGVDCNDANPAINPGAPEVCGDHVDNNCTAGVDELQACPARVPFTGGPALLVLGAAVLGLTHRARRRRPLGRF